MHFWCEKTAYIPEKHGPFRPGGLYDGKTLNELNVQALSTEMLLGEWQRP